MDIQVIIKAPNPNITDHVINCNLDWTVQKLKKQLSESYPNKPVINDQKLIYCGRLLHDHLCLKDVLRHENESSSVHILHLVCNGQDSLHTTQQKPNPHPSQKTQSQPTPGTQTQSATTQQETQPSPVQANQSSTPQQFYQNYANMMQGNDPQQLAYNMAAMSYYLTQYTLSMQASGMAYAYPVMPDFQQVVPNVANTPPEEAPVRPPPNVNPVMNVQGRAPVPEDNDDFGNRDWLEQFFIYCRFFMLFSIVYFYSTPERLMIVVICAVLAFLYHEGWFVRRQNMQQAANARNRQEDRRVNDESNPETPNGADDPTFEAQNSSDTETNTEQEIEAAMDGDDPPHVANRDDANNDNSLSPLSLIATFFSSLIPEPPPPLNLN